MTKLWSTTSMKKKAFLSTKCLHVCNCSCSYCQTTFYSITNEMLTVIFCKQKECTKAIVWNSVTESRWGSRRVWAGQLSKNFSLFVVYEFARFLYVSHLMFYRTERKWVGDNLQQRLWLWSSLNNNNKKSFVNKSPYFQACTAIVSLGLVRQLYYKYIGAAVDCTLKTALIRLWAFHFLCML